MRNHLALPCAAALFLSLGCHRSHEVAIVPPPPRLDKVLPNVPLPPQAQPLVEQHGKNAMQFVMVSPVSPDTVVAYYRKVLSEAPFHLVNENKSGGMTSFYAEQKGPSLWITVQANGTEGSQIVIAGAGADSLDKRLKNLPLTPPSKSAPAIPLKSNGG